jgi:hypothetical protein
MRSIAGWTPAGYGHGIIATMQESRVNKTNEQHCRSQFAEAEGALRLLRRMEMPAAAAAPPNVRL